MNINWNYAGWTQDQINAMATVIMASPAAGELTATQMASLNTMSIAAITTTALGGLTTTQIGGLPATISRTNVAETRSANIDMAGNAILRATLTRCSETGIPSSGNLVLEINLANTFIHTVTGNTDVAIVGDISPWVANGDVYTVTLIIIQGGTGFPVTLPGSCIWVGGVTPALDTSGVRYVLTFKTYNQGTSWIVSSSAASSAAGNLTTTQIANLTTTSIAAITTTALGGLTTTQISAMLNKGFDMQVASNSKGEIDNAMIGGVYLKTGTATVADGVLTINTDNAAIFAHTLSQDITDIQITGTGFGSETTPAYRAVVTLTFVQYTTPYSITLPANMVWAGGIAPSLATPNARYVLVFHSRTTSNDMWVVSSSAASSGGGGDLTSTQMASLTATSVAAIPVTALGGLTTTQIGGLPAAISRTNVAETRSANINMGGNQISKLMLHSWYESGNVLSDVAGIVTIPLNMANAGVLVLIKNTTLAFSGTLPSTVVVGDLYTITLVLIQDPTIVYTVALPTSCTWAGGVTPSLNAVDQKYVLIFKTYNVGSDWIVSSSALPNNLTPTQMASLNTTSIAYITTTALGGLTTTQMRSLPNISLTDVAETRSTSITMAGNYLITPRLARWYEYRGSVNSAAGNAALDLAVTNAYSTTLTENVTVAITGALAYTSSMFTVTWVVTQDATTARTITLGTNIAWSASNPTPTFTTPGGIYVIKFVTANQGTSWTAYVH